MSDVNIQTHIIFVDIHTNTYRMNIEIEEGKVIAAIIARYSSTNKFSSMANVWLVVYLVSIPIFCFRSLSSSFQHFSYSLLANKVQRKRCIYYFQMEEYRWRNAQSVLCWLYTLVRQMARNHSGFRILKSFLKWAKRIPIFDLVPFYYLYSHLY